MDSESNKSDAEEILSEFQKTHGIEPTVEPQVEIKSEHIIPLDNMEKIEILN